MNKLILCLGAIALSANLMLSLNSNAQDLRIIPKPDSIVDLTSVIELDKNATVFMPAKAKLDRAYISSVLNETGIQPRYINRRGKATFVFKLEQINNPNPEAYMIRIGDRSKNPVTISANKKEGLLHGLQTIRQLIFKNENNSISLKSCIISDAPKFPWRAFMLDESRHFHGMEMVKRLLDELARLKMNTFHWHLVDDQGWRIEIKKYPLLTELGSKRDFTNTFLTPEKWDSIYPGKRMFYTQDELREVVRYAAARGIRIIPEIEVPGHVSASVYAYPWLGASSVQANAPVHGDLYNVTDPKVQGFIKDVIDEVFSIFPSRIIHIGGDEANYTHWANSKHVVSFMKANNIPTYADLQVWAINNISQYLLSKGGKIIGWNEITGDNIRAEEYMEAGKSEKLAPGTIVQFWDGSVSLVNKAIEKGYDVVNSNRHFTYLDYPYQTTSLAKAYSFNPIPEGLQKKDESKILGLGCQMWSEFTPNNDRLYYQIFPRLAAYAECGWVPFYKKNYQDFRERFGKIESIWKNKGYLKNQLDQ